MTGHTALIKAALKVALRYPVFPTNNKKPAWSNAELGVAKGQGGYKIATQDPDEVVRLFKHPRAKEIAIPTGEASGLICVDVDLYKDAALQDWIDDHPSLSSTLIHETRSGGLHFIFKHPGPGHRFPSTLRPGVDLKGHGGFICWPGTEGYRALNKKTRKKFPLSLVEEALKLKGGTGSTKVGSSFNEASDDDLIQRIREASELYPSLLSLSYRLASRRHPEGRSFTEGEMVQMLQGVMNDSVAANDNHGRHEDWLDRYSKIEELVSSAINAHKPTELTEDEIELFMDGEPIMIIELTQSGSPSPSADATDKFVSSPIQGDAKRKEERHRLITMAEMMADLGTTNWLIEGCLEIDTLAVLYGAPKTGKTFVTLDMALSIASGIGFHGHNVQQGAVVYIVGEGRSGLMRRTKAWCIEHDVDPLTLPVIWSKKGQALTDADEAKALSNDIALFAEQDVRLIVIDTLNRNFGGADENSTKDMTAFVHNLDQLRSEHGATVLVVHHSGLSNDSRSRGSSVLYGAVDANMQVAKKSDAIAFTVEVLKDADSPPPMLFSTHAIEFDVGGSQATSLVLRTSDVPAHVVNKAEFFAEHPLLRSTGKQGQLEKRLPCILSAMYGGVNEWKSIAGAYGGNGKSTFDGYVKRLRAAGLVCPDRYALTDTGEEATRRLVPGIGLAEAMVADGPSFFGNSLPGLGGQNAPS
jgi:hypothetical protein